MNGHKLRIAVILTAEGDTEPVPVFKYLGCGVLNNEVRVALHKMIPQHTNRLKLIEGALYNTETSSGCVSLCENCLLRTHVKVD